MEKSQNNKKELKFVFSSEIYDELKYVFRKDQLKNIIYRPMIIDEKRWLCSCGFETEADVCPVCGMEKNTVFSKVNANYLVRHRKARLARHSKINENKKAMMAQMIKPTKKKKPNKNGKKLGSLLGILILCIALVISFVMIFGSANTENAPIDQTTATSTTPFDSETNAPDSTNTSTNDSSTQETPSSDTADTPSTDQTPPETDPPVTDNEQPTVIPSQSVTTNVATVPDGKFASGASGNTNMGGLVFSGKDYDYIAKDGITVLDKDGNALSVLTENRALCICGNNNYISYISEDNSLHVVNLETKSDISLGIKAKNVTVAFDRIYYVPLDENGLYSCNFEGKDKQIVTDKEIFAINATADKLYFSTNEGLCVLTSKDGPVNNFCADGAYATSIIEMSNFVFYTLKNPERDGVLKFYNPNKATGFSEEFPVFIGKVTAIVAYENRIYLRVERNDIGVVWHTIKAELQNPQIFNAQNFEPTSLSTPSIFVTDKAIYDGNLNRISIQ